MIIGTSLETICLTFYRSQSDYVQQKSQLKKNLMEYHGGKDIFILGLSLSAE